MTTLEIVLLVALVYLIIGIIVVLHTPYGFEITSFDPFGERFLVVLTILLWPAEIIRWWMGDVDL